MSQTGVAHVGWPQSRAEQLVLDFSEFSEFSLKFRGIRNGILRIRNHSTNTTSGLDKQILYTIYYYCYKLNSEISEKSSTIVPQ